MCKFPTVQRACFKGKGFHIVHEKCCRSRILRGIAQPLLGISVFAFVEVLYEVLRKASLPSTRWRYSLFKFAAFALASSNPRLHPRHLSRPSDLTRPRLCRPGIYRWGFPCCQWGRWTPSTSPALPSPSCWCFAPRPPTTDGWKPEKYGVALLSILAILFVRYIIQGSPPMDC
jgi:hypothetical protein